MIVGIGTDILNLERFKKTLNKYDQKFINRIYGKNEILISQKKLHVSSNYLGKRFSAKEATWKALSPVRGDGLVFREIETLNDINGKPYLFFSGKTKQYIDKKEKNLKAKLNFNISLSDDNPYVITFVVISLAPYV
ncbi:MAG: holo-[acyl-carrier-protein] synthase [Rhodospirillaceae bacterium]|nr:holo-[acyl-carrier-protein] synthase [Rhodospirillaceae bacterium]|tara:strand:+ start:238 stop:645 length:408 start_codon:yes stop_codon:yes gene_type:complete